MRRLHGMKINEGIVVQDLGMVTGNEAHATHVSSQGVDLISTVCGLKTIFPSSKVKQQKLVGSREVELRIFHIHTPYPVSLTLEIGHQMMTNKATGSGDHSLFVV